MARVFKRYNSTIYGNYRKAYAIDGLITGAAMALITFLRDLLAGSAMGAPENYISELVMAAGIFWSAYQYRKNLDEGKVTLKELMLLGLGIGVVSAVVYGLWVWLDASCIDTTLAQHYNEQRIAMMPPAEESEEARVAVELTRRYTAGDWGFIAGFRSAVMSIIIAFFAALVFKTEKGEVVVRKSKTNN